MMFLHLLLLVFLRAKQYKTHRKQPSYTPHGGSKKEREWKKKYVFWGAKGQDPEQTKDLEMRKKMPRGTPKIPYSAKILRREF